MMTCYALDTLTLPTPREPAPRFHPPKYTDTASTLHHYFKFASISTSKSERTRDDFETSDRMARKRRLELVEHFDLAQEPKKMCQLERPYSPFQPIAGVV